MDTSPAPRSPETLKLEITRSADGRLDGRVAAPSIAASRPFSGVLELLRVLEEILDATAKASDSGSNEEISG
jgi:hypothetical protein